MVGIVQHHHRVSSTWSTSSSTLCSAFRQFLYIKKVENECRSLIFSFLTSPCCTRASCIQWKIYQAIRYQLYTLRWTGGSYADRHDTKKELCCLRIRQSVFDVRPSSLHCWLIICLAKPNLAKAFVAKYSISRNKVLFGSWNSWHQRTFLKLHIMEASAARVNPRKSIWRNRVVFDNMNGIFCKSVVMAHPDPFDLIFRLI